MIMIFNENTSAKFNDNTNDNEIATQNANISANDYSSGSI